MVMRSACWRAGGAEIQLDSGYLSLQAESHPIEFRKVEIRQLSK
jgi:hypothetical protein